MTVGALVFILVFWRTSKTGTLDVKEVVPGVLTFVVVFLLTRVVIVRIERNGRTDWNRNMRMTGKSKKRLGRIHEICIVNFHALG
ncbi:MAG: hypothetical protein ACLTBV_23075 [Enterocloster bolteae]